MTLNEGHDLEHCFQFKQQ